MLVTADFSENYSFVLQDAAQGFHWNNSQATIHPFVAYYKDASEKLCHLSYVIISEALSHDTTAVYLYQKCFIRFLRKCLPIATQPKKIIYFSDGAGSQYKNKKNFLNLCHHKEDFGISAEWHFSVTAHGKGACDGVGGTVKRLAARASLQRVYSDQIITPYDLFEWASGNIPEIHFDFCTSSDYEAEAKSLEDRFSKSRTIPGTRKFHSFIPLSKSRIQVKVFSSSSASTEEKVSCIDEVPQEAISGFVTCILDEKWWLGFVLDQAPDKNQVKLTLLHPAGPAKSFRYPTREKLVAVTYEQIIASVDPQTRLGRVYTLSSKEIKAANNSLAQIV